MATFYVSYFGAVDQLCAGDPISSETITTSATSAAGAVIPAGCKVVQVVSDTSHYVTVGTGTPTAAASNGAVQFASSPLWLRVEPRGASLKIAAVTA